MKIYTRKGDSGSTGIIGSGRLGKECLRIRAMGTVDELNSFVGLCRVSANDEHITHLLKRIQEWIFDLGAELATPHDHKLYRPAIHEEQILELENSIDQQTDKLGPITKFILPGGCEFASRLHIARTVCRRAECELIELHRVEPVRPEILAFINRLSDWFFTAARTANSLAGVEDLQWDGWIDNSLKNDGNQS